MSGFHLAHDDVKVIMLKKMISRVMMMSKIFGMKDAELFKKSKFSDGFVLSGQSGWLGLGG